jgi:hypothetical protein
VRKWDTYGDWHYFTLIPAAALRSRNPGEADERFVNDYFYDFNARSHVAR